MVDTVDYGLLNMHCMRQYAVTMIKPEETGVCVTYFCSFTATYHIVYKLGCFILSVLLCFPTNSWIHLFTNHKATPPKIIKTFI